jgi:hypothetical protein
VIRTVVLVRAPSTDPPVGLLKKTWNVLVPSTKPSFRIGTTIVLFVSPTPNDSVPDTATYFKPLVAVPSDVA